VDVTATFVSKVTLNNVDLWIVPELQSFVSLDQTHFAVVEANTPYEITLHVSIPYGSQTGLYDGTIHLRVGSKTYPQTLKIELSVVDAAATIGPEGGVIEVTDPNSPIRDTKLTFSAGSLDQITMFSVRYDAMHDRDDLMARPIIVDHPDIQLHEDVNVTLPLREVPTEDTTLIVMMFDDELNSYVPTGVLVDVAAGDTLANFQVAHLSIITLAYIYDSRNIYELNNEEFTSLLYYLKELTDTIKGYLDDGNIGPLLELVQRWEISTCQDVPCSVIKDTVGGEYQWLVGCDSHNPPSVCAQPLMSKIKNLIHEWVSEQAKDRNICCDLGNDRLAFFPYELNGFDFYKFEWKRVNDDPNDDDPCMGRCGTGCPGGDEPLDNYFTDCKFEFRYSQACLNHDACYNYYDYAKVLRTYQCDAKILAPCADDCQFNGVPICCRTIDFTTFPDNTPIPLNTNGVYGPPGSTIENYVTDEFESWGVVFVSPLPKLIGGPPSCSFCGVPPVGGILISSDPTFSGDIEAVFLTSPLPDYVTIEIIGSGLNISAELEAFTTDGNSLGTIYHTYSGNTGTLSPFTFSAPIGENIKRIRYNGGLNPSAAASIGTMVFGVRN
jgi:hypothetical protein